MKLIKLSKLGEEARYFSTVAKAAKWLNADQSNMRQAIKRIDGRIKKYNVEISDDVVLTSEVDKYTNDK